MIFCDQIWRNQACAEIVVAAIKMLSTLLGHSEGDKQVWLYVLRRHWTFVYIPSCTKWRDEWEGGRKRGRENEREGRREGRREGGKEGGQEGGWGE